MKRQTILTLISLFFVFTVSTQDTWTLEECITYALEQSLTVEQAEINLESSIVNQKEAKNARWPSLDASVGSGLNFGRVINPSTNSFETDNSIFSNFWIRSGVSIFAGIRINNSIKCYYLYFEA
ncbi:MAG: hypothetical protein DRI69_06135, partial [Bacteroidetes bacterium]